MIETCFFTLFILIIFDDYALSIYLLLLQVFSFSVFYNTLCFNEHRIPFIKMTTEFGQTKYILFFYFTNHTNFSVFYIILTLKYTTYVPSFLNSLRVFRIKTVAPIKTIENLN